MVDKNYQCEKMCTEDCTDANDCTDDLWQA